MCVCGLNPGPNPSLGSGSSSDSLSRTGSRRCPHPHLKSESGRGIHKVVSRHHVQIKCFYVDCNIGPSMDIVSLFNLT